LKHIETAIRPGIYDESILDGTFFVKTEDAEMMIRLAKEEGLWVGPSSGAAFWASLRLAESIDRGCDCNNFPDGGRYLSTAGCERRRNGSRLNTRSSLPPEGLSQPRPLRWMGNGYENHRMPPCYRNPLSYAPVFHMDGCPEENPRGI
jgi:hypothetical protein